MNLYIANDNYVDEESLELMYIYINSYRVFQKIGFCLHPAYEIQKINNDCNFEIYVKNKSDFIDLFKKEHVNVKIICGKNGCGKTTLLRLLERSDHKHCTYLFKDKNNRFASTREMIIHYKGEKSFLNHLSSQEVKLGNVCPIHKNMKQPNFSLRRNIVDFYNDKPSLFNNVLSKTDPLITHFTVELYPESVESIIPSLEAIFTEEEIDSLKDDPILFFIAQSLCDRDLKKIDKQLINEGAPILEAIKKRCEKNALYKQIRQFEKRLFNVEHRLNCFFDIQKKVYDISKMSHILLCDVVGYDFPVMFELSHYTYFKGFSLINGQKRYIDDLSDGEFIKLKYSYELIHSIAQSERMFLTFDEPEKSLHPEWCRRFFYDYFAVYRKLLRYESNHVPHFNPQKRMSFFFATHSPFLLSDVTNDYVIYLEKNSQGLSKEVKKKKNIFAGNIGEMFVSNFFMKRTIGAIATKKVKEIFEKIDDENIRVLKKEINMFTKNIGDDLLKRLLLTKWNRRNEEN